MATKEVRQCYLQCMMQRGALRQREAVDLYLKTCSVFQIVGDAAQFSSFVSEVNRPLKPLGLELARGNAEDTGEVWYALVNRTADSAAKIGSCYSPAELELFNKALEMIVLSDSGTASSTRILQEVPSLERKVTHRDAQTFLANLCRDKWLKQESGVLSPGPRFVLELRPFLQELFGDDVSHCHLCKDPVIQGQKCSCGTKLHLYCAAKLFNARAARCPSCHNDWPHPPPRVDSAHQDNGSTASGSRLEHTVTNGVGRRREKTKTKGKGRASVQ